MRPHPYTEDRLVEQPAIGLFAELGSPKQVELASAKQLGRKVELNR